MKSRSSHILVVTLGIFFYTQCTQKPESASSAEAVAETQASRKIISIGGTLSEIVHELGHGDEIVATDKTSTRPKSLQDLPSVGYRTGIKAEGILSLEADLILAEEGYINPEVITQLQSSSLTVHALKHEPNLASTKTLISSIGKILGEEKKAQTLITELDNDIKTLDSLVASTSSQPSVLFVFARGMGSLSVSGKNTFAEQLIAMTGARFAVEEVFDFKPLTPEGLVAANPDYILFFESGLESLGGTEGALQIPGIMQTTAGQKQQLIAMDGLWVSGFGPHVGKAAIHLAKAIYPELNPATAEAAQ
jgi:iron complex transport system substrate-binding protein